MCCRARARSVLMSVRNGCRSMRPPYEAPGFHCTAGGGRRPMAAASTFYADGIEGDQRALGEQFDEAGGVEDLAAQARRRAHEAEVIAARSQGAEGETAALVGEGAGAEPAGGLDRGRTRADVEQAHLHVRGGGAV